MLHALLSDAFNSEDLRRALEGCVEQAQRAGRSLHELLAFLQKGELITERLNLYDVISEALSIVYSDGYGRFHVIFHLEKNLPDVQCNRTQIQKVLINLFRNSIEAMDAMDASDIPTLTITTTLYALPGTNMAKVIVQDNGPGLDHDMAERIFEPFFTTKPTGIGMGLDISRTLAEVNGGQLWIEPDAKPGAKFQFTLPFAP